MEPSCETIPSPTPVILSGSCSCGKVKYTSGTLPIAITICHCLECRKPTSAPFLTFGLYHNSALIWQAPPEGIKTTASEMAVRGSCRSCDTLLYMKYHCRPDGTSVTIGTIDDDSIQGTLPKLKEHIFLAEKRPWWELSDSPSVARHDGFNEPFQLRLKEWDARGRPSRTDIEVLKN